MKTLFIKSKRFLCDEGSASIPAIPKLSCQIFLAASYCRSIGLDVEVYNPSRFKRYSFENFDVVVSWVPLYEGFYEGLSYLEDAKKSGKTTVLVLNDPLEGLEMEAMRRFKYIDYCIRLYEREYALGYLLRELEKGNRNEYHLNSGLIYHQAGKIVDSGKMPPLNDLRHLPSTAEFIQRESLESYREVFIETGRGCLFGCTFCFYNGTPQRKRDFKDILSELKVLEGRVRHVWLHDLNMLVKEKWVGDLCNAVIESGISCRWATDARLDECSNINLLRKLKKAGCYMLVFGIESASEDILKRINKRVDFKLLEQALENCRKAGIKPELNIMYGFPWDNQATMKSTEAIIRKYPVTCIMLVRPLRGTFLYEEYKKLGLIKKDMTLDDYIFSKRYPAYPTLYLSRKELYKWHRRFESIASRCGLKRKIKEEGLVAALGDWIRIKGFRLLNLRKIIEHILS